MDDLRSVIAEMRLYEGAYPPKVKVWADRLEAVQALQAAPEGGTSKLEGDDRLLWGVVANAGRLSHERKVRWSHVMDATSMGSTSSAALCRRFGFDPGETVGIEDQDEADDVTASPAQPSGFVLVPIEPTEEMIEAAATAPLQSMQKQRQRLSLGEILRIEYAAMLSAAPSPTAALQAGVGRFVACRCVSERDRELCMTKDECSKVYAYSDTAPKEPTK